MRVEEIACSSTPHHGHPGLILSIERKGPKSSETSDFMSGLLRHEAECSVLRRAVAGFCRNQPRTIF
jgi:RNA:NAD 2'-phosphotransferase (TPT1/KptA family)